MDEPLNQAALIVMAAAFLLSLLTIVAVLQRRNKVQPLLEYEPRRRVPWGPLAAMIPILFLVLSVSSAVMSGDVELGADDFVASGWFNSALMIGFVAFLMAFLSVAVDADAVDFGLPSSFEQLTRDVWIGVTAGVASIAPIYMVQYFLQIVFQPQQQHQLIEQVLEHRSSQMMLVGIVMAVVAAPIFEEFTFRVLLQGWLERIEDGIVGYRPSERRRTKEIAGEIAEQGGAEGAAPTISYANPPSNGKSVEPTEENAPELAHPERGMIDSLPHGWTPILISSVAFGMAHFGHGVDPIPLVAFGAVLGYLYQRTHRLAPCVAAHMMFNGYSMTLLWLHIN